LSKRDLARVTVDTTVQPKNVAFPTDARLLESAIQQLGKLAKALPGNPYDGHTLKEVIEETETLTGREIERAYVDKGYVGHDAAKPNRVFKSGQKRGVHGQIKKELRRRSAIEAVIGHCKTDGHMARNFLKGRLGDQINAVMTAVGYNFRLILKWLRKLLCKIIAAIWAALTPISMLKTAS
jgi:IS5 family transposase